MINSRIKIFYINNKFMINHSFFSIFLSGFGMLLLLIQNIMVARFFGETIFGIFSFITNLFIILGIFSKFGIEELTPREIPRLLDSSSDLKGLYIFAIFRTIIFSIIVILFVYVISIFYQNFNFDFKSSIFIIGIWFILRMIVELFSFFFQSINKTISSRLILSIFPPMISILLISINYNFNFFIISLKLIFQIIILSYFISFFIVIFFNNPFYLKKEGVILLVVAPLFLR